MIKKGFVKEKHYCPKCCNHYLYYWGSPDVFASIENSSYKLICDECGWEGSVSELVTEEEYKNLKRTELIDKILK